MSRWVFTAFVVMLALQRLYEMGVSRRHEAIIRSRGGHEYAAWQVQAMKVLHAGWLVAMPIEVYGLGRPFIPALCLLAVVTFAAGQALRYAALLSLKWRWTIKVMVIPGLPPVHDGIYRYLHHPNYLGVMLEILAAPLLHSAYVTAIAFSLANLVLLSARIRTEDKALFDATGSPPR